MSNCYTQFKENHTENLNLLLVNRFDEILQVSSLSGDVAFDVYVRTGVTVPVFVKKLNAYALALMKADAMNGVKVCFRIYQNRALMHELYYNGQDSEIVMDPYFSLI